MQLNMAESYKYIKKEAMEARKKELLTVKNKVAEALKGRKKVIVYTQQCFI